MYKKQDKVKEDVGVRRGAPGSTPNCHRVGTGAPSLPCPRNRVRTREEEGCRITSQPAAVRGRLPSLLGLPRAAAPRAPDQGAGRSLSRRGHMRTIRAALPLVHAPRTIVPCAPLPSSLGSEPDPS
jgi:hypothetical protein